MRIALLAPLWKEIPPIMYGGTELVVANLERGLTELGHDITTFACGGSRVKGELVSVTERPMYDLVGGFDFRDIKKYELVSLFELGKRIDNFDIVHNHMGLHAISVAPFVKVPFLTTLHCSELLPDFRYFIDIFKKYPFISISKAQRSLAPFLNFKATIYHGIDIEAFEPGCGDIAGKYVFIGALSRKKGVDIAIRCALKLKSQLTIAGPICREEQNFLDKKVFPLIDGKKIRYIGEIDHKLKNSLLSGSTAMLFPSRWCEAFGLIMAESLACGTPVIALNNGSAPEIIRHGKTGFIATSENEFIGFARRAGEISRHVCRKEAERRFGISIMAKKHAGLYRALIASKKAV